VGRGHGSGKSKNVRPRHERPAIAGENPFGFEGGQLALIKRLPLLRGKDRNNSRQEKAYPISVDTLNKLPEGTTVTLEMLLKYHMIDSAVKKVKILGGKALSVKLTVNVPVSKSAQKLIEKAGGSISSHE